MSRKLIDLARDALREAYAVQASDLAAKAHARRALTARGHDEAAVSDAVESAFARWFALSEAQ